MAFTKFTLADIRTSVKRKLDDATYDDATIDEAANDFQFELFNDNRIRFMEKNAQLSVLTNATSVDLPTDFMNLINLISTNGSSPINITKTGYLNYDDFMEKNPGYATATSSQIQEWTFFGEGIRFANPSDDDYTLSVDYMKSPALMTLAGDTCELPVNCRELMTLGTLERIMRVNEDYNESDFEASKLRELRNAFLKNYARGWSKVGPQVLKTGRGRASGWNAARDF